MLDGQVHRFEASREALTAARESSVGALSGAVAGAAAVIAGAAVRATAYVLRPGSVREVDLWVDGTALVLHADAHDESAVVAGSVHHGPAAALALAELVAVDGASSPTSAPDQALPTDWASPGAVIEWFGAGGPGGGTGGVVLVGGTPAAPSWAVTKLHQGSTWWAEGLPDGRLDLRTGAYAQLWSSCTRLLEPIGLR